MISENFEDKHFLLIEDDEELIVKLTTLFNNCHLKELVIKSCYDEAFAELKLHKHYDLIIFDIMLPRTNSDFSKIRELKKELNKHIDVIIRDEDESPNDSSFKFDLERAREKRRAISCEINKYIDQEAGIELIEEWTKNIGFVTSPPIITLTAIGANEFIKTQERINKVMSFKNVSIIPKPVTTEKLIKEIKELLQ
jgi:CheY-like chemotaxis protein